MAGGIHKMIPASLVLGAILWLYRYQWNNPDMVKAIHYLIMEKKQYTVQTMCIIHKK